MRAGRDFAEQGILDHAEYVRAFVPDLGLVDAQLEVHHLLLNAEFLEQVVEGRAVRIEDLALERAHAQVFQGDGVLVAHRLQTLGHHVRHGFQFGLRAEAAQALDRFGQHHVVVRDVGDDERAHVAPAPRADRAGRTWR